MRPPRSEGPSPFGPGTTAVALLVARGGMLPPGSLDALALARGVALVIGSGALEASRALWSAGPRFFAESGAGLRPGALARSLAPLFEDVPLVVLPASADGRDLAPRLAHRLGRPLLAQATRVEISQRSGALTLHADLSRLEGRVLVPVEHDGPAIVTLELCAERERPSGAGGGVEPVEILLHLDNDASLAVAGAAEVSVLGVREPDPETMELAEAPRVLAGGAGLVSGDRDIDAMSRARFGLLDAVAHALGAVAGATRVITDAGLVGHDRQIGTTGVSIDPELYVAFGISGASQHLGGIGRPRHVVSVNTDPSCPMTAVADLGIVADAGELLVELAGRLGVALPAQVLAAANPAEAGHG